MACALNCLSEWGRGNFAAPNFEFSALDNLTPVGFDLQNNAPWRGRRPEYLPWGDARGLPQVARKAAQSSSCSAETTTVPPLRTFAAWVVAVVFFPPPPPQAAATIASDTTRTPNVALRRMCRTCRNLLVP